MPDIDNRPLFKALIQFQKSMQHVAKDKQANTGKFAYSYADIAAVIEAIREPLATNGLCYTQMLSVHESKPALTTMLCHESGAVIMGVVPLQGDLSDPQKFGGIVTYYRRYALLAILGLATDDDDAQHARTPAAYTAVSGDPGYPRGGQTLPPKPSPQTTTWNVPGASQWVTDWSDLWGTVLRPKNIMSAEQLTTLIGDYSSMSATEVHQKVAGLDAGTIAGAKLQPDQPGYKMTEKQWSFVHSLARKKGLDKTGLDGVVGFTFDTKIENLDSKQASTLVDELKALPDNPHQAAILEASGGVTAR